MRCPSCATENETGRKFCHECGTRLVAGCPTCGASNQPDAKFCGECGTALVAVANAPRPGAASDPITERRTVSVLFADLVGFTTMAETRDAEEVRELQDRYFATCRAVIDRYGGTLEKFIGDAVMAVWGAPTTHEDDAERAVRAALDLLSAVAGIKVATDGPALEARAAVMTGEAAVAVGATDQGLVTGDLINTASRLQGVAPGGAVFIDEPTHRITSAAIAAEAVGEQELRGRAMPVPTWRALHTLAMVGGRGRSERLEPPFVGRDAELRLLKDVLHAVNDEGRARLVSVTGIAGIGKSRLAWELEKYIDGIVSDVYWHQGRSPAYGEGVAFWALAEMVRSRAGIAEIDDPETSRSKLATTLESYVPDEAERRTVGPWLMALLGLRDVGEIDHEAAFAAARRLIERIAERGLAVFVFEDLQWADDGLVDFIESVLEWSRNHRILILTLARPELLERRPTWGAGQRNFTAIHLDPLSDEAIIQLLDGVAPGLPRSFVRRIVGHAAGIPLYAVETLRMLIDEGQLVPDDGRFRLEGEVGQLAVPESLRGLIGARIDGLPPADRTLLQDASVLGLSFTFDALAALTNEAVEALEPRLRTLVRREILALDHDPGSPERGQYTFVQGLIREVAYETLAKKDRRARHLAAARYFETLESDELAGILASHYLDAHRATPEGPEADALAAQARIALRGAAERAAALGSYALALDYLEKALTVTPDPADTAAIHEAAASAARHAAQFATAQRHARAAIDWYRAEGDPRAVARATMGLVLPYFDEGRTSEATAALESALAFGDTLEDDPDMVAIVAGLARVFMQVNDPRALDMAERALVAAEHLDATAIVADALVTKAAVLDYRGRRLEGLALVSGGIELAHANGFVETELRGRSNLASQRMSDDPGAGLDAAVEVRELARRSGNRDQFKWATWQCYTGGLWMGRWDWVLELTDEVETIDPTPMDLEGIHGIRALIAAYRGDAEAAADQLARAAAAAPDASRPEFLASRHSDAGEIAAMAGRLSEAYDEAMVGTRIEQRVVIVALATRWALWSRDFDRARAAAELLRADPTRGRYVDSLRIAAEAGVAALADEPDRAAAGYRRAIATFRELGVLPDLGIALTDFATLLGPDLPGTREAAAEARQIFEGLGAKALIDQLAVGLEGWIEPEAHASGALGGSSVREAAPER